MTALSSHHHEENLATLRSRPAMRFVFQRCYDIVESFDVGGCYAPHDAPLQMRQVPADAAGQLSTIRGQPDQKRASVGFAYFARDQSAINKAI